MKSTTDARPTDEPLAASEPLGLEPQLTSVIPLSVEEVHASAANGGEPLTIAAECDPAYAWRHGSQRVDVPDRRPQQVRLLQQVRLTRWCLNDSRRHLGFRIPDHDRAVFIQARQITRPRAPGQLDQSRALRKGAFAENLAS